MNHDQLLRECQERMDELKRAQDQEDERRAALFVEGRAGGELPPDLLIRTEKFGEGKVQSCKRARLGGAIWHSVLFEGGIWKQVKLGDPKFKWEVVPVVCRRSFSSKFVNSPDLTYMMTLVLFACPRPFYLCVVVFQNEEGNCLREIQDAVEECTEIYKTRLREVATKNGAPL